VSVKEREIKREREREKEREREREREKVHSDDRLLEWDVIGLASYPCAA
jgi:hypothetical protein